MPLVALVSMLATLLVPFLAGLLDWPIWVVATAEFKHMDHRKFRMDRTGKRRLATIRIDGVDVGDMLIEAGLARRWPDGDEFWCQDDIE